MHKGRFVVALAAVFGVASGCAQQQPTAPTIAAAESDAEYLLSLGLMRGHLLVGHALFAMHERSAAQSHAKHPSDELYAALRPAFAARGVDGFEAELAAHAAAVANGDESEVSAAYAALMAAMAGAEQAVATTPSLAADVIVALLDEAAREYAIGIVDGDLANAHEYQDAYGFTQVALALAQREAANAQSRHRAVFERIVADIRGLADMWPELMPPPRVEQSASRLRAAALEVERRSLSLEP